MIEKAKAAKTYFAQLEAKGGELADDPNPDCWVKCQICGSRAHAYGKWLRKV